MGVKTSMHVITLHRDAEWGTVPEWDNFPVEERQYMQSCLLQQQWPVCIVPRAGGHGASHSRDRSLYDRGLSIMFKHLSYISYRTSYFYDHGQFWVASI